MNDNIELLGNSQTFLGVLATLIIFFIFRKDTNLINSLLVEFENKVLNQIRFLISIIPSYINPIIESDNNQILSEFINSGNCANQKLNEEAYFLSIEISSKRDELITKYMVEGHCSSEILRKISNRQEFLLSPFYTLLFVIIIFVFDELLRIPIFYNEIILSWLACIIVFSYIFMLTIWAKYMYQFKCFETILQDQSSTNYTSNKLLSSMTLFQKIVFCFTFMILFPIISNIIVYYFKVPPLVPIFISYVLPFILLGLCMAIYKDNRIDYSFLHFSGHFIIIVIVSFFLVLLYYKLACDQSNYNRMFIAISGTNGIIFSILCFTILNGILLPFALPCINYLRYYFHLKHKVYELKHIQVKLESKLATIVNKIQKL